MNQKQIDKFVYTTKKEQNLTQSKLVEMLRITDSAVSK